VFARGAAEPEAAAEPTADVIVPSWTCGAPGCLS
jgi:hypothetical protein